MSDDDFDLPDLPSDEELGIEGMDLDDFEGDLPEDDEDLLADIDLGEPPSSPKAPTPPASGPPTEVPGAGHAETGAHKERAAASAGLGAATAGASASATAPPPEPKEKPSGGSEPPKEKAKAAPAHAPLPAWTGLLAIVFMVLVGWLSLSERALPRPVLATAPDSVFSSGRAMAHIEAIAERPHPPGSPEHDRVRDYVMGQLRALGLTPEIQTSTYVVQRGESPYAVTVRNILARVPGTASTGGVLLTAHYDSRRFARGAGDDGTGVAAILETMRALGPNPGLQNDLIILITDAEELGLVGARAFVDEHPWMEDVSLVLSVEMRGGGGASIMFETAPENGWVVDALRESDPRPFANSLSLEVYRRMPNDTDFTPFLRAGVQGLNFAAVGRARVYHQEFDNPENLDEATVQHHGMRLLAVTRELAGRDLASVNAPDKVYFSLPFLGLVTYPVSLVLPMAGILGLLTLVVGGILVLRGDKGKAGPLVGLIASVGALLLASGFAWGMMEWLTGRHAEYGALHGSAFHAEGYYVLGIFAAAVAVVTTLFAIAQKWYSPASLAFGALVIPVILAVFLAVQAPSAAHVFAWPSAAALFGVIVLGLLKKWQGGVIQRILLVIASVPVIVGLTPVVELLWLGLTLSAAPIVAGLMVLGLCLLLPAAAAISPKQRWWLPLGSALLAVAFILIGLRGAGTSPGSPAPATLLYALDRGTAERPASALWASRDGEGLGWARTQVLAAPGSLASGSPEGLFTVEASLDEFLLGNRQYRIEAASLRPLQPPTVQVLEGAPDGILRLGLTSSIRAETQAIRLVSGGRFVAVGGSPTYDGEPTGGPVPPAVLDPAEVPRIVHQGTPEGSLVVDIEVPRGLTSFTVEVVELHQRGGELLGEGIFRRPPHLFLDVNYGSDRVLVRSSFRIDLEEGSVTPSFREPPEVGSGAASAMSVPGEVWQSGPLLPRPVTNNAVVGVETTAGAAVFSFLGLDSSKAWSGVVNWAFRWNLDEEAWTEVAPVPGPGRLASTAQAVRGKVYLFGGYTVAEDGTEVSVPNVDIYDPETDTWSAGPSIPVPVDDAVSGLWKDSLILLVSGWRDDGNVPDVQWFDPASGEWSAATPIPGDPVFGHAGAVAGDVVIYRDGAAVVEGEPRFQLAASAWQAAINPDDPSSLNWSPAPRYPGPGLYRAASVGLRDVVLFAGGTSNPYNYNGIGYDGVPAEAVDDVVAFQPSTGRWITGPTLPVPSMDHRSLGRVAGVLVLAGGMDAQRNVTDHVWFAREDVIVADLSGN